MNTESGTGERRSQRFWRFAPLRASQWKKTTALQSKLDLAEKEPYFWLEKEPFFGQGFSKQIEFVYFFYRANFRRKEDARKSVRKLRETLRANPTALILAFDLEVYEHNHSIITEIGYAMTSLNNPEEMRTFHYIIEENLRYASVL